MGTRGRKSKDDLATLKTVSAHVRADAPYDLTDEETEVWHGIVNALPAEWFNPGNAPVLAQYCRTVIAARRIGQLIRQAAHSGGPYDMEEHLTLIREQNKVSATIKALATALRLTPQSRYTPGAAATASKGATGAKPWNFD